ncbi:sugar phosphate isomerase/epimerase [Clostridium sp. SYSU_GA19001]|uniref:sugar phosphate isomerase/epimerase family protein n=1 Tax=Clostridium caldaquaticum TaxID=2940653 RepID=UPI002076E76D|nr:sugar phosphate isomerase/epimerase [Clostridium caldaquaticum]MCM8711708.1 sugar phosphate isomerase/epimerase [Clostridium caldaquaticum]
MTIKAVQQFQLRTVMETESKARETLQLMKEVGYNGIELNGFMIKKMPMSVRILTRMAGMPMGRSGNLNWKKLIIESGLKVVSVHEDLGSILNRTQEIIEEAKDFKTEYVVLTGMHHFDYSDKKAVLELIDKLNHAGKLLKEGGINFLYHNHNCEFRKVELGKTAYELILQNTDPQYVNFEFDSYWPTEAGADVLALMDTLGERMKLYHINDRGSRVTGRASPILKSDSIELGYGNMNLKDMVEKAKNYGVKAIILESHRNWIDKSPIKSFQVSADFLNKYV